MITHSNDLVIIKVFERIKRQGHLGSVRTVKYITGHLNSTMTVYMIFLWHQILIIACVPLKNKEKNNSFAYLALAFKVVWHTPFKTFKGGDPNNASCTTPSYSNCFSIVHPWELWLAETMWEWQKATQKKDTMNLYQKELSANIRITWSFRERSILTGPKSTIHYEYYINESYITSTL